MRVLVVVTALASVALAGHAQEYRPFTATIDDQYWTESGRTAEYSITFARSRDGSYAFISESDNPLDPDPAKRGHFLQLFNVSHRWFVIASSLVQAAVVRPIASEREFDSLAKSYGACESLSDGTWKAEGRSEVLGIPVVEVEVERTERSLIKEWVAPELACFALKRMEFVDGELRVKKQALTVEMKEPPASTFMPPAGYAQVNPMELENRYQARFPGKELFGTYAERMEREYERAVGLSKK